MDIIITPNKLSGNVTAIPSKSHAHRLLICSAFSSEETKIICPQINQDMEATADCLRSLGAEITHENGIYHISPVRNIPKCVTVNCRESGSTLRFLLPVMGALGIDTTFAMGGRLPQRPLSPLWEELERMGCHLERPTEDTLRITGKLSAGEYIIDGGVSSQFITGLLFAMALMDGKSKLTVTGNLESKPYVDLTCQVLNMFDINTSDFVVSGPYPFVSPKQITVEGDWSNAAFFYAAAALGCNVTLSGLDMRSAQGDREIITLLRQIQNGTPTICGKDIPDLIPVLAVTAGTFHGAHFTGISRLRAKESDRIASVCEMLSNLGVKTQSGPDTLTVYPGTYHSCVIDAFNDHRIAMSAAVAACVANGVVTIKGANCVEKSYPGFWEEYRRLGGIYEQYLR